jgi:rare lipoprotein A
MKYMKNFPFRTILILAFVFFNSKHIFGQKTDIGKKFKGNASYYHPKFEGRKTASGQRLDNEDYTCAHRTLPFGTMIEVVNPVNKKWIIVRVNDRGPFSPKRVIDITFGAAKKIGMLNKGVIKIEAKVVGDNGIVKLFRDRSGPEDFFKWQLGNNELDPIIPLTLKSSSMYRNILIVKK